MRALSHLKANTKQNGIMAATVEALARGCCSLAGVPGPHGLNKVVWKKCPKKNHQYKEVVVFVPGDVQNTEDRIQSAYLPWSLESVLERLNEAFPDSFTMAIQARRIEQNSLSCYDNFVKSDWTGAPSHDFAGKGRAIQQLQGLLASIDPIVQLKM